MAKTLTSTGVFLGEKFTLRQEGIKKLKRFFIYLSVILIFFSGIFFIAWQEIYIMKMTYEIQQSRLSLKELTLRNKKLKYKISALSSLNRIESEATKKLSLKTPKSDQVRVIEK